MGLNIYREQLQQKLMDLFLLTFQLSAKLLIEIIFDVVIIPIVFPNIDFVFIFFAIGPFCNQIES